MIWHSLHPGLTRGGERIARQIVNTDGTSLEDIEVLYHNNSFYSTPSVFFGFVCQNLCSLITTQCAPGLPPYR